MSPPSFRAAPRHASFPRLMLRYARLPMPAADGVCAIRLLLMPPARDLMLAATPDDAYTAPALFLCVSRSRCQFSTEVTAITAQAPFHIAAAVFCHADAYMPFMKMRSAASAATFLMPRYHGHYAIDKALLRHAAALLRLRCCRYIIDVTPAQRRRTLSCCYSYARLSHDAFALRASAFTS